MDTGETETTEMVVDKPSGHKTADEEDKYDWKETIQPHIKIAVVGEHACGKTSMILAAKNEIFPHPDEKFVSKQHVLEVDVGGKMEVCMVAEADASNKNSVYSDANVVLLCYDEMNQLQKVEDVWIPDLRSNIPDVPVILVRIKKRDLEYYGLTPELAEVVLIELNYQLKSVREFLMCYPHTGRGVKEVFQEAVKRARK